MMVSKKTYFEIDYIDVEEDDLRDELFGEIPSNDSYMTVYFHEDEDYSEEGKQLVKEWIQEAKALGAEHSAFGWEFLVRISW